MKVSFKEDDVVYSLDKAERDDIRHVRNLTREIARFIPEAAPVSNALTKVLASIDDDGVIGTVSMQDGKAELRGAGKSGDK